MKNLKRITATTAGLASLALVLAACSADADAAPAGGAGAADGGEAEGRVSITVGGLPTSAQAEERAAFLARLDEFRGLNPDIDIDAQEIFWDETVFAAQVAGGTLPTVISVPPGEVGGLANRGQIRDVTEFVEANETVSSLPDAMLEMARTADGRIFGVPEYAYSMGLLINRDVFVQAGLDPDEPLRTWDEVRAAARQITENTGIQGFALPATEGWGGWIVSSMTPGFGGAVVVPEGDSFRADLQGAAITELFETVHAMAHEDGSMGTNALLSGGEVGNMIAAGQLGMAVNGGDAFQNMTLVNGMPAEHYGMFAMPQTDNGIGTSGGGRVAIVRPDATDAQVEAVVRWLEFNNFQAFTSETAAVHWAEARVAEGLPVPQVGLPRVSGEVYEAFMGWIEPFINVPMDQIQDYLDSAATLPITNPFPVAAGEVFQAIDPVIQGVIANANADVHALLADAQAVAQAAVEAALQD